MTSSRNWTIIKLFKKLNRIWGGSKWNMITGAFLEKLSKNLGHRQHFLKKWDLASGAYRSKLTTRSRLRRGKSRGQWSYCVYQGAMCADIFLHQKFRNMNFKLKRKTSKSETLLDVRTLSIVILMRELDCRQLRCLYSVRTERR